MRWAGQPAGATAKEPLFSWRRLCFFLIGVLCFVLLFNAAPRGKSGLDLASAQRASQSRDSLLSRFGNARLDNEAIDGLTEAECLTAFPDLYYEIDRTLEYWRQRNHTISASDVQIGEKQAAVRLLIHDNELRILESTFASDLGGPGRVPGTLHLIQRALDAAMAAGEKLPTIELTLNLQDDVRPFGGDDDSHTYWTVSRAMSDHTYDKFWIMPNFDFWYYAATGSFRDAKLLAMQHDIPFARKIPQIVWRGNPGFNPLREDLLTTTKGKDWADVALATGVEQPSVRLNSDEFCKYAMTVYTEGVTYSGRFKFLMNCNSLLFAHDIEWATHYTHLLVKDGPKQNYVAVARDWSDLEEKVTWYLDHPDEANSVIANSIATFRSRYTTRAATSCYYRRLIRAYGSVAFTPEVDTQRADGKLSKRRGWSFERFLETPGDHDFEHMD